MAVEKIVSFFIYFVRPFHPIVPQGLVNKYLEVL